MLPNFYFLQVSERIKNEYSDRFSLLFSRFYVATERAERNRAGGFCLLSSHCIRKGVAWRDEFTFSFPNSVAFKAAVFVPIRMGTNMATKQRSMNLSKLSLRKSGRWKLALTWTILGVHLKFTSFKFPRFRPISFEGTVLIFVFDGVAVKTSNRNVFAQLGCTLARSVRTDHSLSLWTCWMRGMLNLVLTS